ncbi:MAG: hypothetical protein Q8R31_05900 [Candidatus Omnitrophota bacterium]|nr:hypothetical protein [Candidatus Omnitrophota bacterium]
MSDTAILCPECGKICKNDKSSLSQHRRMSHGITKNTPKVVELPKAPIELKVEQKPRDIVNSKPEVEVQNLPAKTTKVAPITEQVRSNNRIYFIQGD